MAFKLRSVNTKFWEDPFIEKLKPDEKLLFLYLLTNPLTNMLGIYEISVKRMSYDTGMTMEKIQNTLKHFESLSKVFYKENYIILPNFLKNQNLNTNMQKGAINVFNELPNWLKDSIISKPLEGFESLSNALISLSRILIGSVKEEEEEKEEEDKDERGLIFPFDSDDFLKWWDMWKEYKLKDHKFKYKSVISEQAALKKLSEIACGDEQAAIKIIEQSIAQGWAGFFELKTSNKVTGQTIQDNLEYFAKKKAAGDYD